MLWTSDLEWQEYGNQSDLRALPIVDLPLHVSIELVRDFKHCVLCMLTGAAKGI